MIHIGKSCVSKNGAISRLSSEVLINDEIKNLWVEVEEQFEGFLTDNEVFLLAMLPYAMKQGLDIQCDFSINEKLFYQLTDYFVPAFKSDLYKKIKINAEISSEKFDTSKAVGTLYSESLQNLLASQDLLYPITHVLVFGTYDENLLEKSGLIPVFINSNFEDVLDLKIPEEKVYLNYLYPLALKKLFSTYIVNIEGDVFGDKLNVFNSQAYNLLLSMTFSSGGLLYLLRGRDYKQKFSVKKSDKVIKIGKPYVESKDNRTYLNADLDIAGEQKTMYFSVEEGCGKYFVEDRCDAFVAAVITTAMREGFDIVCEAPVTRRILYWVNNYLIPTISSAIKFYNSIEVKAQPIDVTIKNVGAIATGWTGGVDCFYSYLKHSELQKTELSRYKLTHLFINNNGALEGDDNKNTLNKMIEKARKGFASDAGLDVVGVDTNIQDIFPERFLTTVSYRHSAVVLALQNLVGCYLMSSSEAYQEFEFGDGTDAGFYEIVVYQAFTAPSTSIYCSGASTTRAEKVKALTELPLSYKYIHPCVYALHDKNCTKCEKCVRIVLLLDALGVVDKYAESFDLDWYRENLDWCLSRIFLGMGPVGKFIVSTFKERGYNLNKAKFIAFRVFLWRKLLDVKNSIKVLR